MKLLNILTFVSMFILGAGFSLLGKIIGGRLGWFAGLLIAIGIGMLIVVVKFDIIDTIEWKE